MLHATAFDVADRHELFDLTNIRVHRDFGQCPIEQIETTSEAAHLHRRILHQVQRVLLGIDRGVQTLGLDFVVRGYGDVVVHVFHRHAAVGCLFVFEPGALAVLFEDLEDALIVLLVVLDHDAVCVGRDDTHTLDGFQLNNQCEQVDLTCDRHSKHQIG